MPNFVTVLYGGTHDTEHARVNMLTTDQMLRKSIVLREGSAPDSSHGAVVCQFGQLPKAPAAASPSARRQEAVDW